MHTVLGTVNGELGKEAAQCASVAPLVIQYFWEREVGEWMVKVSVARLKTAVVSISTALFPVLRGKQQWRRVQNV